MAYENIVYEKRDRVGVVTLNRPEYLNGLAPGMGEDITNALGEMESDPEVLVTVITGTGRAFCAGAFIRDPKTHYVEHPTDMLRRGGGGSALDALYAYRKPVVAAVNGPAYGAGLNMVLLSDFVIASTEARFCFPMTRLGFLPGHVGGPGLQLYVGKAKAAEMAIMSRPIDGEDAYRWGLANRVVPPDQLMDEAMAWATEIAQLAPLATVLAKEDLRESWKHHIDLEGRRLRVMAAQLTEDCKEGHRAWREKRAPVFTGR